MLGLAGGAQGCFSVILGVDLDLQVYISHVTYADKSQTMTSQTISFFICNFLKKLARPKSLGCVRRNAGNTVSNLPLAPS